MDSHSFPGIDRTEIPVPRPPSPPYIHIPAHDYCTDAFTLEPITASHPHLPQFDLGVPGNPLSREQVSTITQGSRTQYAPRAGADWSYESRRRAQPILSYLYLGPASVARDHAFLRSQGITLLLAARDRRQAVAQLLTVGKSAAQLGIAAEYVDVSDRAELISGIPLAVSKINAHLLSQEGKGKVLVCCESGNERSAALVAAYVMTMYDADLVRTVQFIHYRRVCANFDDDFKFLLRSYGDIVAARRMVGAGEVPPPQQENRPQQQPGVFTFGGGGGGTGEKKAKRGIDETAMDEDDGVAATDGAADSDLARFSGRHLTPFVDAHRGGNDVEMGMQGQ